MILEISYNPTHSKAWQPPLPLHLSAHLIEVQFFHRPSKKVFFLLLGGQRIFEIKCSAGIKKHFLISPMASQHWRTREGRCHGWWQATGPHNVHNEPVRSWEWSWKCLDLLCKLLVLGVFLNCLSAGHPSEVFVCTLSAATSASKAIRALESCHFQSQCS